MKKLLSSLSSLPIDPVSARRTTWLRSTLLIALILWAGYFCYGNLRDEVMGDASLSAHERVQDVQITLNLSNEFYLEQCRTAIRALRNQTLALGPVHLQGTATVAGKTVPDLAFGASLMANNFAVVDEVTNLMGGTATIFVRDGDSFVRLSTNVQTAGKKRAIGTTLNPQGAAIAPLLRGETFSGVVDILGNSFIAQYDPILDAEGKVIGAWYVGYPVRTLTDLMARINSMHVLQHGFVALLDSRNVIVAHSSGTEPWVINEIADRAGPASSQQDTSVHLSHALSGGFWHGTLNVDSGWRVHKVNYAPWNYTILAATYVPDVFWRALRVVWIGLLVMGFFGLAALVAQGAALSRARELRTKAEAAQRAAEEASQTKSAFLANMSHELRTPLNAIIGYSEMIIEEASETMQDIVPDLEKIRSSGKHLLALINDILDLSKIEAGKMTLYLEDFDVAKMTQEVASTIRPLLLQNGNTLEMECPEDIGPMHGDLTKTRQVLFNLLSNASKFTKQGRVRLRVERAANRFVFRITDTGIGMSPLQMGRLFKEFSQADESTTRKFGGTGLGLAICKRFCEMMGGKIDVTSTPGVGSTFSVTLPAKVIATVDTQTKSSTVAAPVAAPLPAKTPFTGTDILPRVLVVDDDPAAQNLLKRILEKEHYEVAIASSGQQALQLCSTLKPCLITLDVMMPDLDGWAILKKLKADPETANIPVIMVTMVDDQPLGLALGAADYVTKPFDRGQMVDILRRHGIQSNTARVLVIDDDPDVYRIAAQALEKDGFKTSYAPNGRTALGMIEEAQPDLIVLDLNMPEMNGIDFLAELHRRQLPHPPPIVIFSAKDLTESEAQLLRLSTKETLIKGSHTTLDLVEAVKRRLE